MRWSARVAMLLGLSGLLLLGPSRAHALTVDEMLSLLKGGVSEDVILMKLKEVPGGIDLSSEEMVQLREAGASDKFLMEVLKAAGDTAVTPDERADIVPAPESATLMVFTEPTGARVVLDGVPVGVTPYVGNQLEPGQHELYMSKRYYRSVSKVINARVGDKLELKETLPMEMPGMAIALRTKGLPKGNRWTVRGTDECGQGSLFVERENGLDAGRVVLRSRGGRLSGTACVDLYFWMQAQGAAPDGTAPVPDLVFRIEGVDLDAIHMTELDVLVARDDDSPTGVRCVIVRGPGRVIRNTGANG